MNALATAIKHGIPLVDAVWQLREPNPHLPKINWVQVPLTTFVRIVPECPDYVDIAPGVSMVGNEAYLHLKPTGIEYFINSILLRNH